MKTSNAISSRKDSPAAPPRTAESFSSTERFALSGPSPELDPRYNAYRGDLADVALAQRLFAPHYASPVIRHCGPRGARLRDVPEAAAEAVAELQPGEAFALLDVTAGWAWGYREADHRVGYLPAADLSEAG